MPYRKKVLSRQDELIVIDLYIMNAEGKIEGNQGIM